MGVDCEGEWIDGQIYACMEDRWRYACTVLL